MSRKIRVTVEFPFAGVSGIKEYYDLPDGWDEMPEKKQDRYLRTLAAEEISTAGVGSGATVVDTDEE